MHAYKNKYSLQILESLTKTISAQFVFSLSSSHHIDKTHTTQKKKVFHEKKSETTVL